MMKKIFLTAIASCISVLGFAQLDSRQRTVETVVDDVLAQMPAQTQDAFNTNMKDLAEAAPESIRLLAESLVPASQGKNSLTEYALSGVAAYASAHKELRGAVREGLVAAATACKDADNQRFLLSQLRLVAEPQDEALLDAFEHQRSAAMMLTEPVYLKINSAYEAIGSKKDKAALKYAVKAMGSDDKAYRNAVIGYAAEKVGAKNLASALVKIVSKLSPDAQEDVVNFIGTQKVTEQLAAVKSLISSSDPNVAKAAINSAALIGGADAAQALVGQLGGKYSKEATAALMTMDFDARLLDVDSVSLSAEAAILNLAGARHIAAVYPDAVRAASYADPEVHDAALKALAGVSRPENAKQLASMLDQAADADVPALQKALSAAVSTLEPAEEYKVVKGLYEAAGAKDRFYTVLASTGDDAAVADLKAAYNAGDKKALSALVKMDNLAVAPVLLSAAKNGENTVMRYAELVNKYETKLDKKRFDYSEALKLASDSKTKGKILGFLGAVPTMKAFLLASEYLDSEDVAYQAAYAVKNIAGKTKDEIDYNVYSSALGKAKSIIGKHGGADDGYAVDEITLLLSKAEPFVKSELTDEEKKAGFEMLFDGTDLSKWQGDLDGYVPMNGTIYVSANYGSDGNLYTKKEYRNFVFRFEFCFLREGVNNGVGVRTPMGVDAAYQGLAEIQILDHDAPAYVHLKPYQVHGSVYGVIPAKRIVHKPLGEWSTEEIVVKGDHITVTVNGEVIVDGDVRKACKGHNVAPDGSKHNPYTVDGKNHPGMFNKKGFISFCGHGEGLKLRNVRVLDLGDRP